MKQSQREEEQHPKVTDADRDKDTTENIACRIDSSMETSYNEVASSLNNVSPNAYTLVRSAYEKSIPSLLEVMLHHKEDEDVIWHGLWNLSKFEFVENDYDGSPDGDATNVYELCLKLMQNWKDNIRIQGNCILVLVTLSDVSANRVFMSCNNIWLDLIEDIIYSMPTTDFRRRNDETSTGSDLEYNFVKKNDIPVVASPNSNSVASNSCMLLSRMAYDEDIRRSLVGRAIPLIMHMMKICFEDTMVIQYCCFALYNFVHRNEDGHEMANGERCTEFLSSLILYFDGSDKGLVVIINGTLTALKPGGWNADLV